MLRNGFMGFNRFKVVKLFNFLEFILTFSRSRLLKISGAGASFFFKTSGAGTAYNCSRGRVKADRL